MANLNDIVARLRASAGYLADGNANPAPRRSGYGEVYSLNVVPTKHILAEEGSYFVATNPTIATALADGIVNTFSDTQGVVTIQNTAPVGVPTSPIVFPDYIAMLITVAPASGTSLEYATKLEPSTLRTPTAANAALTLANTNGNAQKSPLGAAVQAFTGGAIMTVPAASASARIVGRGRLRTVIPVAGDVLILAFGAVDPAGSATAIATASRGGSQHAPVAIPPGGSLTVHMWSPSNATTGLSAEIEVGLWER